MCSKEMIHIMSKGNAYTRSKIDQELHGFIL